MSRTAIAFLVAPLWVPFGVALYCAVYLMPRSEDSHWTAFITAMSAMLSYAATFAFGCPTFLLLRWYRLTAPWIAIISGFVIGVLAWVTFLVLFALSLGSSIQFVLDVRRQAENFMFLLGSGLLGVLVGLTLWLIARPDRWARQ